MSVGYWWKDPLAPGTFDQDSTIVGTAFAEIYCDLAMLLQTIIYNELCDPITTVFGLKDRHDPFPSF